MIPATPEYLALEAIKIGATPAIKATIEPYYYPNGITAAATYVDAAFVAPGRIQVNYGVLSASWMSPVMHTNNPGPATISWVENKAGYDLVLYWRSSPTIDLPYLESGYLPPDYLEDGLVDAPWLPLTQNEVINLPAYYQFKAVWTGSRCWASDSGATDDGSFAYAEDSPGNLDDFQGFAVDGNSGYAYIEDLLIAGIYDITHDV